MRNSKIAVRHENGVLSLRCVNNRGVTYDVMCVYVHTKISILLTVLSIFCFPFYDLNLNTQGFVYSEFVKNQLGLHRNMQGFVKRNVCIQ